MNDKELADAVVALGIGTKTLMESFPFLAPNHDSWSADRGMTKVDFVRDWRVTGALMEKCWNDGYLMAMIMNRAVQQPPDSLPRSLTEVCVSVLTVEDSGE